MKKIVLGITGASGAIIGIRLLEFLREAGVETHLVLSKWGARTIELETDYEVERVVKMASAFYPHNDMAAAISSGSFLADAAVIAPCSMKTLSAIANGYSDNLVSRCGEVALKEGRKLVVVPRETPLTQAHIQNMLSLSRMGAVILPPSVAFYHKPRTIDDVVNQTVGKILDCLGIENQLYNRWH